MGRKYSIQITEIDGAENSTKRWATIPIEIDSTLEEVVAAMKDFEYSVCAYCGHKTKKSERLEILDHILTCDKRPEKTLLDKAFEIDNKRIAWIRHLIERVDLDRVYCATCHEIKKFIEQYDAADKEDV